MEEVGFNSEGQTFLVRAARAPTETLFLLHLVDVFLAYSFLILLEIFEDQPKGRRNKIFCWHRWQNLHFNLVKH